MKKIKVSVEPLGADSEEKRKTPRLNTLINVAAISTLTSNSSSPDKNDRDTFRDKKLKNLFFEESPDIKLVNEELKRQEIED